MNTARPVLDSFAVGLVLAEGRGEGPTIEMATARTPSDAMRLAALEPVRRGIPAARVLPLLERIARAEAGRIAIDYLDGLALAIDVRP